VQHSIGLGCTDLQASPGSPLRCGLPHKSSRPPGDAREARSFRRLQCSEVHGGSGSWQTGRKIVRRVPAQTIRGQDLGGSRDTLQTLNLMENHYVVVYVLSYENPGSHETEPTPTESWGVL
jgi:hypothetical protein